MPELPEVEVVRRGLVDHVVGRTIESLALSGSRVARRHLAGPGDLEDRVAGRTVVAARRRGKYLWMVLGTQSAHDQAVPDRCEQSEAEALVVHLGMSGQLLVQDPDTPVPRHQHALVTFTDAGHALRFVDQRTFGGLSLVELIPDPHQRRDARTGDPEGIPESVVHIAPDPFEPAYDPMAVAANMKRRSSAIKRVLLDQRVVSGVGNIYADEALWRAGVHPLRPCDVLTRPALLRILGHVREVMAAALDQGGTSFDALYVNVNGASGYFSRSLHAYGREGEPCQRCGNAIVRERFMNRSSYSCPVCQRKR